MGVRGGKDEMCLTWRKSKDPTADIMAKEKQKMKMAIRQVHGSSRNVKRVKRRTLTPVIL
jgi:hypothetical protein